MRILFTIAAIFLAQTVPLSAKQPSSVEVNADRPIEVLVNGVRARLTFETGTASYPILNPHFVARNNIRPYRILSKSTVKVWGRKEFVSVSGPVLLAIAGEQHKTPAAWFPNAPSPAYDGTIGQNGFPQHNIVVRLKQSGLRDSTFQLPLQKGSNDSSLVIAAGVRAKIETSIGVEFAFKYPVASAALGAALANLYDGQLSGDAWNQEFVYGVSRPVRLLTLSKPFVVGPFSLTKIAVRVRSAIDSGGVGDAIADADVDPDEILVTAARKGKIKATFTLLLGRPSLAHCSSMTFEKLAKRISFRCVPSAG